MVYKFHSLIHAEALEELEDFWHTLSKDFEEMNDGEIKAQRHQDFSPLFIALIKIAIGRMVMTEEQMEFIDMKDDSDDDEYFDEFEDKDR